MDINYNAIVMYITEYEMFFNENYSLLLERYERFKDSGECIVGKKVLCMVEIEVPWNVQFSSRYITYTP